MLVESGLSPLEAIQTATINPAVFSGLESEFGSVTIGKQADFILLNRNPLTDIRHTKDIHGVMFAGHYYDREALHSLDNFVLEMAASVRVNLRFLYDILASPLMRIQLAD
jgi:adenine deaminase